jgi:hypothetical protein
VGQQAAVALACCVAAWDGGLQRFGAGKLDSSFGPGAKAVQCGAVPYGRPVVSLAEAKDTWREMRDDVTGCGDRRPKNEMSLTQELEKTLPWVSGLVRAVRLASEPWNLTFAGWKPPNGMM